MRRSAPPKRRAPLRRNTPIRTRSRLLRRTKTRDWIKVKRHVLDRANHRCEARIEGVCQGRARDAHHLVLRSQGGPDEPWNLIAVCRDVDGGEGGCHSWIHRHPAESYELGLLRRSHSTAGAA